MKALFAATVFSLFILTGCGLKVIDPSEPNNEGTLALDVKGGQVSLVETYTCKLKSMGNRFSAIGKTEVEARTEVLAKCKDRTLLSVCKAEEITCAKN
ncbi:hypothetical protein D3C87_1247280 [compost metagenome]